MSFSQHASDLSRPVLDVLALSRRSQESLGNHKPFNANRAGSTSTGLAELLKAETWRALLSALIDGTASETQAAVLGLTILLDRAPVLLPHFASEPLVRHCTWADNSAE